MKPINTHKNLKHQLQQIAIQAKGSHKTVHDRTVILTRFAHYLKTHNIQIKQIDQIKAKYIQSYIEDRQSQGISQRTLQNEMAAIRQTLRTAGRDKLADTPTLSNKALNLDGASRKGTKVAITDSQYQQIHQTALTHYAGLAATLELARTFGLRSEEAVQSIHSLHTWQTAIEKGDNTINVIFGTKGGRPRETLILDRERATNAINTAIQIAEQHNGKLIDKPTLKQAMTYWRNHTSAIGLKGQLSPHSLRYAWAQEAIEHYLQQGYNQKEALALTSMNLGHGDGRGRYVKQVYGLIHI